MALNHRIAAWKGDTDGLGEQKEGERAARQLAMNLEREEKKSKANRADMVIDM